MAVMAALFQKFSRAALRALLVLTVLYGTFFMPVGPFTLFGHVTRIASTPEAHEFVDAIFGSFRQIGQTLMGRVRRSLEPDDP